MSTKPFTDVEIIEAVGIKLKEMRAEMEGCVACDRHDRIELSA